MPRKLCFAITILVALTALTQTLEAQQTHVVGYILGWTVPPGGTFAYQLWTSSQKFTVGDILVFNFATGQHTVTRVTKQAFDSCNSTNPMAIEAISPANFTLDSVGDYYFICSIGAHCPLGQKLAINVAAAPCGPMPTLPFCSPLRPLTTSTRRDTVSYVVGDALGWLVPPGGATAYSTWASPKTFTIGDSLVFNFVNKTQDVALVTKSAYENCDTNDTISVFTTSPARVTLTTSGVHYFTSTYPLLCTFGQKLAINVRAAAATSPSP